MHRSLFWNFRFPRHNRSDHTEQFVLQWWERLLRFSSSRFTEQLTNSMNWWNYSCLSKRNCAPMSLFANNICTVDFVWIHVHPGGKWNRFRHLRKELQIYYTNMTLNIGSGIARHRLHLSVNARIIEITCDAGGRQFATI